MNIRSRIIGIVAVASMLALTVAGCAQAPAKTMAQQVKITDVWVMKPSKNPMATGMFASLENTGSVEAILVGGSSAAAGMVEVHEVTDGQMQAIEGGLKIAASSTEMLAPGANHLMLMDLQKPLEVGDEVTATLEFSDGSSKKVTGFVKSAAGGEESYNSSDEMSHGGM